MSESTDDKLRELRTAWLADQEQLLEFLLGACESPVEKLFLMQGLASEGVEPASPLLAMNRVGSIVPGFRRALRIWETWLVLVQADVAPYRLDFAMVEPEKKIRVAIEIDGHEFHDRTKEQASRTARGIGISWWEAGT